MKTLQPITVGEYTVNVSVAEHARDDCVSIIAALGALTLGSTLHFQGAHDHSEDQFLKDINAEAERLAREVAGKARAKDLRKKFLAS
jgi:hypothetical protein